MMSPERRFLEDFPYPVAYPYSLVFNEDKQPSIRRWALCFTEYQLLRMVCLPLVGQYLREPIDDTSAAASIASINTAIASIRSPFFSDWITLIYTLKRHLRRVGIEPLFAGLDGALEELKGREARPVAARGDEMLDPLRAMLALRNATAHGALPDEEEARQHLALYLPILHQVLRAFDFLGDVELLVTPDGLEAVATGRARLRRLRGAELAEPVEQALSDELVGALKESPAVLVVGDREPMPLYPLFNPIAEVEPLYLYDGHYGIRVETKQHAVLRPNPHESR